LLSLLSSACGGGNCDVWRERCVSFRQWGDDHRQVSGLRTSDLQHGCDQDGEAEGCG
jgi:hypothetical protein